MPFLLVGPSGRPLIVPDGRASVPVALSTAAVSQNDRPRARVCEGTDGLTKNAVGYSPLNQGCPEAAGGLNRSLENSNTSRVIKYGNIEPSLSSTRLAAM